MLFKEEPFNHLNLTYDELVKQEESDLDEKFKNNKSVFEKKLKESRIFLADDLNNFLDDSENKSLMYFEDYEELIKRFDSKYPIEDSGSSGNAGGKPGKRKKTIPLNGKDEEYDEDDYQSFMDNIDSDLKDNDYDIKTHNPEKPEDRSKNGTPKTPGGKKKRSRKNSTKEIGFIGEYYVYKNLVRKFSKENVFWVSGYAKMADVNPDGNDNLGYDIRYIDENGQVHYAEVKSSSDDDYSFPISSPEVRFGEAHKNSYEIIQVLNVLSPSDKKFQNLGNIFAYDEEETFNYNSKFSVENDGFRIRFK